MLLITPAVAETGEAIGFSDPLHGYWTRPTQDRFSRLKARMDAGEVKLETASEKLFLTGLLEHLEVPVSSQMLAIAAISLQKAIINPRNPRALYFNEDTYVGYVPGGKIEIVSLDPDLGGIFYIFDRVRDGRTPRVKRTDECMTCHAPHYMHEIPGLVIESVVPGISGGGETAFRRDQSGHSIPFELRFGGWHLTGAGAFPQQWANIMMEYTPAGRRERLLGIGELFDINRYPVPTSDILPHLLHEHQVGFVNRMVEATYASRASWQKDGSPSGELSAELDRTARALVRYLLFADEVPLPSIGVLGDEAFKIAFLASRKSASDGASLKDLDLQTRLFRHRCSYMIYSPVFKGLPRPLKERVYRIAERALAEAGGDPEFAYLPIPERREIRTILKETVDDLPAGWGASTELGVR